MSYTVKFISHEDFDNLPYNKVATSIGVADRNAGVAYVRDTGNPMDIFTAYHELEHLKGDDLHEYASPGEDGIFYKDSGQWVQLASTVLAPFTGPAAPFVAAGGNAAGAAMSNRSQQKAANSASSQAPMDSFNPSAAISMPQAQPATSSVGGGGDGGMGGGLGQGTMDKVRQTLQKQNQSGFYSGRNVGNF